MCVCVCCCCRRRSPTHPRFCKTWRRERERLTHEISKSAPLLPIALQLNTTHTPQRVCVCVCVLLQEKKPSRAHVFAKRREEREKNYFTNQKNQPSFPQFALCAFIHTHITVSVCMCVCVCLVPCTEREREKHLLAHVFSKTMLRKKFVIFISLSTLAFNLWPYLFSNLTQI